MLSLNKSNAYDRHTVLLLRGILFCLTFLFICAQLALFIIHYRVSILIDSLVNSSIASTLWHPVVVLPLLQFISLQLIAYLIFVYWLEFLAIALARISHLNAIATRWLGIFLWFLACSLILLLNQYYFPDSFFAGRLPINIAYTNSLITGLSSFFIVITLIAAFSAWRHKQQRGINYLLFTLCCAAILMMAYDRWIISIASNKSTTNKQPAAPNIILIGLDSLRPDFVHANNPKKNIRTPNIDAFLQTSADFSNAYTPLARTFPAWMSILTAKYPKHHLGRSNLSDPQRMTTANDTLAKQLQRAGYETIYASDEKRFSNITTAYGFDKLIGPTMGINDFILGGLTDFPLSNLLTKLPGARFLFPYQYGNRAANVTYEPDQFLHLLQVGLAQRTPSKPLFLAIHLCLTHWPYTWARDHQPNQFILPQRYQSSVEALDAQFGQVLQLLKERGLLNQSMVVLLSDHGTTLGLPHDRMITKNNYVGDKKNLKLISIYKRSTAPSFSINFKKDYSINTSYGQGTDVLSIKQYQVLLAFKGYGVTIPPRTISTITASLIDIAPTLLDFLSLPALTQTDGMSLKSYVINASNQPPALARVLFIETADTLGDIETDKIQVDQVVNKSLIAYQIDQQTGLLFLKPIAAKYLLKNKQRAIIMGDWLLARYPARHRNKIIPTAPHSKEVKLKSYTIDAYHVLINLKTGKWTIGTSSPSHFIQSAPLATLQQQFQDFYQTEWQQPASNSSQR